MANKQYIDQFNSALKGWKEFDFTNAIRRELGAEAFVQLGPIVAKVSDMLAGTDLVKEDLSNDVVHNMGQYALQIRGHCAGLLKATPSEFITRKTTALQEIEKNLDGMRQVWPSVLAVLSAINDSPERRRLELHALEERVQYVNRLIADLDNKAETFTKATDAISKSSIIKEEEVFSRDAARFRSASWIWLVFVVLFCGVFFLTLTLILRNFCTEMICYQKVGEINYDGICTDCNRSVLYLEMAKAISFRVLLISFILFLVGVCVKNYYAAMHNYTINTHKANSLAAARTMLGLNLSKQGHDQLMTMAASAIFSHQSTGYNNKRPENPGLGQVLGAFSGVKPPEEIK
ncbi:MAG: hypothetical protein IT227_10910 [Flavobacteriales bacterium]|nr:hypothetical protein [Flavobacteriales bacterium]